MSRQPLELRGDGSTILPPLVLSSLRKKLTARTPPFSSLGFGEQRRGRSALFRLDKYRLRRTSRRRWRRGRNLHGALGHRLLRASRVRLAAKHGVLFDRQRACINVALHEGAGAEFDASRGANVTVELTENHNVLRRNVAMHAGRGPDGKTRAGKLDRAVQLPVHHQVFGAGKFSVNFYRLANDR